MGGVGGGSPTVGTQMGMSPLAMAGKPVSMARYMMAPMRATITSAASGAQLSSCTLGQMACQRVMVRRGLEAYMRVLW